MQAPAVQLASEVLIKPFEGYARAQPDGSCTAYPDPGSGNEPWTIGWGSTGKDVRPGTTWSRDTAAARLAHEVSAFAMAVAALSPRLLKEPDRRYAAIISFVYNCGTGNYRISTLRKRVNTGDWHGAKEEIVKWNKARGRVMKGLTRRRAAEAALL